MNRPFWLRLGKKVLIFLMSVLILSIAVFVISRLAPGDPLVAYYGERTEKMSPGEKTAAMEKLGLNDPIHVQYVRWLKNACRGDFGISYRYKQDVLTVISQRIGGTLLLGGVGALLIFVGALGLGLLCAWFEDRWIDKFLCKIGTVVSCIPEFWLSILLIFLFSVTLHILPSSGAYDVGQSGSILSRVRHLILPLTVVTAQHLWYYAYLIRNRLLEETRADYVLLGRAKGLSRGQVLFGHCLRNVMPTYMGIMAISVPHIIGGTYIVEAVFSYPGIGSLAYESARYHDYNLLMVLCLLTGACVIFFGMLGNTISGRLDPRLHAADNLPGREAEGI